MPGKRSRHRYPHNHACLTGVSRARNQGSGLTCRGTCHAVRLCPAQTQVSVLGRALDTCVQDLSGDKLGVSMNLPGSTKEERRAGLTRKTPNERGT